MVCLLVVCAAGLVSFISCQHAQGAANARKMIILGVDGLDPELLTKFMAEGKMPNFARLAEQGSFRRLDDQYPAAEPGRLVEPDHRDECRRPRDF